MACRTISSNCTMKEIIALINDINRLMSRFSYAYYIIAILIICINLFIMLAYLKMSITNRSKIPNFMLFCHSFVDIFVGISCLCSVSTNRGFIKARHFGPLEFANHFITKFIWFLAIGNLLLFTTERYIAVKIPLFYRSLITKMKVTLATLLVWILSSIPAFISTTLFQKTFESQANTHNLLKRKSKKSQYEICTIVLAVLILAILILLFTLIYYTYKEIKSSTKRRTTLCIGTENQSSISKCRKLKNRDVKKNKRILSMFLLMSIGYALLFLPSAIFVMIDPQSLLRLDAYFIDVVFLQLIIPLLHICNGLMNPFVIIAMSKDYRQKILSFITPDISCLPVIRSRKKLSANLMTTITLQPTNSLL